MNTQPWYKRLYNRLLVKGVQPRDAEAMVKCSGKHTRGKVKPHDYDAKRKTRRKMAKVSRRINRRML